MICISIKEHDFEKCKRILTGYTIGNCLFELRADLCGFTPAQIEELTSLTPNLIITCRSNRAGGSKTEKEALELMTAAIRHGAKYADIEIEASPDHLEYIKAYATANSCKLIVSYHNFTETPTLDELCHIRTLCERKGADIVKIVTTAHSTEDSMRVLSLYNAQHSTSTPLVAFAMGEAGRFTRLSCLYLKSPFTYCSIDGAETAPGQYCADEVEQILNPANYPYLFGSQLPDKSASPVDIPVPCSKSIAQRAIIAAALANGTTILHNYTPCNDSEAALSVITALGCRVERSGEDDKADGESAGTLKIFSPGVLNLGRGVEGDNIELNTGESGLLARLLMPLSAIIARNTAKKVTLNGIGSILHRDLSEAINILMLYGIKCSYTVSNNKKATLPITIGSGFFSTEAVNMDNNTVCRAEVPDKVVINGACSSQTISGILMALPLQNGNIVVHVETPASVPYLDLTVDVLKNFSVVCKKTIADKAIEFVIAGNQEYTPCECRLAADWSSAAYFKVLEILGANINITGMHFGGNQADEAIMDVCTLCKDGTEDTSQLKAFDFDATDCPDLFPIISTLALFCNGTSKIRGVHRLAEKESNRAESICCELLKTGAKISIENDSLIIEGDSRRLHREGWGKKWTDSAPLLFDTHNDHRIAMSLIVLSCKLPVPVKLNNIGCIDKSFPGFLNLFNMLLQ